MRDPVSSRKDEPDSNAHVITVTDLDRRRGWIVTIRCVWVPAGQSTSARLQPTNPHSAVRVDGAAGTAPS